MSRLIVTAAQILADPSLSIHDEQVESTEMLGGGLSRQRRHVLQAHALDVALMRGWPVCPGLLRRLRRGRVAA